MRIKPWLAAISGFSTTLGILPSTAQDRLAHQCVGPTAQQQQSVAEYMAKKNHAMSSGDLTMVRSEKGLGARRQTMPASGSLSTRTSRKSY
jgi:hypothetical protein